MSLPSSAVRALIPSFSYQDAPAAIAFLCTAFGFEKHIVHESAPGFVEHAQLKLGNHFIMLGSVKEAPGWPSRSPKDLGGTTGGVYVVLATDAEVDAHCARARAAGAEITRDLESPDFGGRTYSAKDGEGYLWSFGSFRPESAP